MIFFSAWIVVESVSTVKYVVQNKGQLVRTLEPVVLSCMERLSS